MKNARQLLTKNKKWRVQSDNFQNKQLHVKKIFDILKRGKEKMLEVKINKKYKDRLFCLRFGSENYKEDMLSLYNALNGTDYQDVNDISITTIDDAIYIHMKNDVSILLDGNMLLWEQQSTFNPNMPVRGLMYFGNLYDSYIQMNELNIYGTKLQKLPTPQYAVFYNGTEESEAITELRLSDAFINESKGGFEWTATVYNLNRGKNDGLLEKCKPLSEYMELINRIRDNQKSGMDIKNAIDAAVDSCIADGIMKEFLKKHKSEVVSVCLTEFNEKVFAKGMREEGYDEGMLIGETKGKAESVIEFLEDCGNPSETLRKFIMSQTDLKVLRQWNKIAAHAESIEDFEKKAGIK